MYTKESGLCIQASKDIVDALTVKPKLKNTYSKKVESFPLYQKKDDGTLSVPRFWAEKELKIIVDVPQGLPLEHITFHGELREPQKKIIDEVLPKILNFGGGVLSLPCGYGKTCIAIFLFSILKLKTLVLVHKTFLLNQWIESIKKFTNAKVGLIQQNTIDIDDKDIVIGMLQSVSMKDYHHSIFEKFDFLVVDEVHNVATKVFSKALSKINTKYTLGLSATPERDDGLSKVFYWYLGEMIYKMDKVIDTDVRVNLIHYSIDPGEAKSELNKFKEYRTRAGELNLSLMLTNISQVISRNKLIVDTLKNILEQEQQRNVLVLSSRIDQLEILKKQFDNLQTRIGTDYYIGKMKEKELKKAEEKQVLFATYEMVNEGFDLPKLNTLIFATPRSKIEQAVGRIMRTKGEIKPLIIDIVDELSSFKGQSYKRIRYYKNLNYQIHHF